MPPAAHHWDGRDRKADVDALADAIAASVEGLCNHDEQLVRLDGNGELVNVNMAAFRELIDKSICGIRVVNRGSGWQREYFTYEFAPRRRPDPMLAGRGPLPELRNTEPDSATLDQLYRSKLLRRIPKVES
jgi:hypothetical protein